MLEKNSELVQDNLFKLSGFSYHSTTTHILLYTGTKILLVRVVVMCCLSLQFEGFTLQSGCSQQVGEDTANTVSRVTLDSWYVSFLQQSGWAEPLFGLFVLKTRCTPPRLLMI